MARAIMVFTGWMSLVGVQRNVIVHSELVTFTAEQEVDSAEI